MWCVSVWMLKGEMRKSGWKRDTSMPHPKYQPHGEEIPTTGPQGERTKRKEGNCSFTSGVLYTNNLWKSNTMVRNRLVNDYFNLSPLWRLLMFNWKQNEMKQQLKELWLYSGQSLFCLAHPAQVDFFFWFFNG